MKRLLAILFALFALVTGAAAQSVITASVLVTNTCSNNFAITLNGSTRTWQSAIVSAPIQIQTTTNAAASATNLFLQYAAYPQAQIGLEFIGSNQVNFQGYPGAPVVITILSNWATVSYSTNVLTNYQVVRVPLNPNADGTNAASGIVTGLQYSSNAIPTNTVASSLLMDLANTQTAAGAKFFTGSVTLSNASQLVTGGSVSNVTIGATNGWIANVAATNLTNYGNSLSSVGTGTASQQFGNSSLATNTFAFVAGILGVAGGFESAAFGFEPAALGSGSTAIGEQATVTAAGINGTAIGGTAGVTAQAATALGYQSYAAYQNSTAVGFGATTTAANQVMLGSSVVSTVVNSILQVLGSITNSTFTGTNNWQGDLAYSQLANTGLANGNNAAVSPGTAVYMKVSGPTAAFAINGLTGGRDGRYLVIENAAGHTMDIANDSGVDPAATNRIYTGTGSDVFVTTSPGFAVMIYDFSVTHWKLIVSGGAQGNTLVFDPAYFNTNLPSGQISLGPAGTLWTNYAGLVATNATNAIVSTSNALYALISGGGFSGTALTNFIGVMSTNATNFAQNEIGTPLTNWVGILSTNGTNFAGTLSTNATNWTGTISTNATNFTKTIGTTASNVFQWGSLNLSNFWAGFSNVYMTNVGSGALVATHLVTNNAGNGIIISNDLSGASTAFSGTALTNFVGVLSTNATNWSGTLSTNATNFAGTMSTNATNYAASEASTAQANAESYAAQAGATITNWTGVLTTNLTNFANGVGAAITNWLTTGLVTNNLSTNAFAFAPFNDWDIWNDEHSNYYAFSPNLLLFYQSNDFCGLLSNTFNQYPPNTNTPGETFTHIKLAPCSKISTQYGFAPYLVSNTIFITNTEFWIEGSGNPETLLIATKDNYTFFNCGTTTPVTQPQGIDRFSNFRMQLGGLNPSIIYTNNGGFSFTNVPEPIIEYVELNDYGGGSSTQPTCAGIMYGISTNMAWGRVDHCWFVGNPANSNAQAVLTHGNGYSASELLIDNNQFNTQGCQAVVLSNYTEYVKIENNVFIGYSYLTYYGGNPTHCQGIDVWGPVLNGMIIGNQFQFFGLGYHTTNAGNCVVFESQAATNLNWLVADNTCDSSLGNGFCLTNGNVTGVECRENWVAGTNTWNWGGNAPAVVTLTGSPFTYTVTQRGCLFLQNSGNITGFTINGTDLGTGMPSLAEFGFPVQPADIVVITYPSTAPKLWFQLR